MLRIIENSEITFIKSYKQLTNVTKVSHSHLYFLDHTLLKDFQRVFILRRDPIQTILSFYLATYYKTYHNSYNEPIMFEKIEVKDYELINKLCKRYIKYHSKYSDNILNTDLVIFYEDLVNKKTNKQIPCFPVYHNKQDLITNYNHIIGYLTDNYEHELKKSQVGFENHKNIYDIYNVVI